MLTPWYKFTPEETMKQLGSSPEGLRMQEVAIRQQQYGLNKLPEPKRKTLLQIFLGQFLSPLIYVLIAAAVISLFAGTAGDAAFIMSIIVINALLGTWQESKAEYNASALRNMVRVRARVRRAGQMVEIDAQELVPGDVVLLESGMKVPCDVRLAQVNELTVEEALLTGESLPVMKQEAALSHEVQSLGDRVNMAFAATTVLKGRAWGVATSTGIQTEMGKIADSLASSYAERPPLLQRMDRFASTISKVVLVVCVLLGGIGWWRGMEVMEIFLFMIAVAVSAIPEGLPVALTVVLSIGTSRMAKRNVIVRRLPAVEGLGSCTMIASDKTGTLTMDQQSVQALVLPDGQHLDVTGQGYNGSGQISTSTGSPAALTLPHFQPLLQAAVLCNEASLQLTASGWEYTGDPVDVALLALAYKAGVSPAYFLTGVEVEKMVPYESENKFSGVFYRQQGELCFWMKGAVEVIAEKLPPAQQGLLFQKTEALAKMGFRVIALAGGPVREVHLEGLPELSLAGIIGLIDPLREEAKAAVQECQAAGIEVAMVTGDHPETAFAIARQLGLAQTAQEVISGKELAQIQEQQPASFAQMLKGKHVFARVTPLQKKEIVEALKENGHFVAVTGDGANDAPALKAAHIGIAMGSGTDLAKDTASLIITDNNFASITAGVEEGRFTYNNLRNIIYMLLSTGAAELLLIACTLILGLELPFIAVQLLWLNLVTNGIQDVGLAFEKGDASVMKLPPRKPEEGIFNQLMIKQLLLSAVFIAGITLVVWYILTEVNHLEMAHARSTLMMLMVLLQNFHVLNCRSETKSLFKTPLRNNYLLVAGILTSQLLHIAASYIPFLATTLQLEPIYFEEWLKLVPTAMIIFVVMEVFKWLRRQRVLS
ncbi:cation-translocating P-type ATPase [Rufibacter quisquiliarum]|uniref:Magnesium-transporting ATPase (P-type) n=1 Tax=Rufibacter quisquiliarum TaxID=1549639 RepID=A0A839GZV1_9BACT|nr:HAD-IC family P-type ATPase [Rufibacter quisquiliarum]MBA9079211.1 magnesium-transporting ATPase (P-type) [Rufibacter quisquiliarum]